MRTTGSHFGRRTGTSIIELAIVLSLFTIVMLSTFALIERGRDFSASTLKISTVEDLAQQMLFRMETELSNASGIEPNAVVAGTPLTPSTSSSFTVDSTKGLPPSGTLIMERGTSNEERIEYTSLNADAVTLENLTRGAQCTTAHVHALHSDLMWAGLAEVIDDQDSPDAQEYDGRSNENGIPVYFRGDGTGFSYRVPVDPTGNGNFLDGDELIWGSEITGIGPTIDGYAALYFLPKTVYDESVTGNDINEDSDAIDVFDVGQIRLASWDTTAPGGPSDDTGMGPSAVIQERCNYGGDLDDDGFDDPMFLWNKDTNELHVRIFLLGGTSTGHPVVRQVESLMFLRNEPEL